MEKNFIGIVTGTGTYNDIGVIRSLGEKHIPVYYITNEEKKQELLKRAEKTDRCPSLLDYKNAIEKR